MCMDYGLSISSISINRVVVVESCSLLWVNYTCVIWGGDMIDDCCILLTFRLTLYLSLEKNKGVCIYGE